MVTTRAGKIQIKVEGGRRRRPPDVALSVGFEEQITVARSPHGAPARLHRNITVNSFNGIQTFPSQRPFGMSGRGVYGRLTWQR